MTTPSTSLTPSKSLTSSGRARIRSVAWHLGALAVLAVILYPVVWVIGGSFKPGDKIIGSLQLLPTDPITENYRRLGDGIADVPVTTFFTNSLFLAVGSVIGVLISCSLAAYAFARIRFLGRGVVYFLEKLIEIWHRVRIANNVPK